MYKLSFFGESASLAESIFYNPNFELKAIFCEKNKINNDLLTFSFLRNIPIFKVENNLDLLERLSEIKLDFVIMCGFGIILNKKTLNYIKVFNIHPGKLPNYKGRHPTFFATINGDKSIFFTLHEVIVEIDKGKIIDEVEMPYYFWQNEYDIQKFLIVAFNQLMGSLILYIENKINSRNNSGGKYYPRVEKKNKILKTDYPASKLLNIIRAQAPYGGGIFLYNKKEYLVSRAEVQIIDKNYRNKKKILITNDKPIGIIIDKNYFLRFTEIVRLKTDK